MMFFLVSDALLE